jgi:glycerol kinase
MQCLTDVLNTRVVNIGFEDVTALGTAYLAGLEGGLFESIDHLQQLHTKQNVFTPGPERENVYITYEAWEKSVKELLQHATC